MSRSIFLCPKYLSNDILYILSWCQYLIILISTIAGSTLLTLLINKFDCLEINYLLSTFPIIKDKTALDNVYLTWVSYVQVSFLACCKASFRVSIKSTSNFSSLEFRQNKILYLSYSLEWLADFFFGFRGL